MSNHEKIYRAIISGNTNNLSFRDFIAFLEILGFSIREGKGSHKIAVHEDIPEILTLQPTKDHCAKPYQVRQVRKLILKYKIGGGED